MKKFTGNKRNIAKAVYAVIVGVLFQLAFQIPSTLVLQLTLVFVSVLLYALPLVINAEYIKNYEIPGVKALVINDALFLLPEAVVSAVATELVYAYISGSEAELSGMGSVIFIATAILLTAVFWGMYCIVNAWYKKKE